MKNGGGEIRYDFNGKMEQNKKIDRFLAFGTALALYIGVNTTDRPAEKVVKKE